MVLSCPGDADPVGPSCCPNCVESIILSLDGRLNSATTACEISVAFEPTSKSKFLVVPLMPTGTVIRSLPGMDCSATDAATDGKGQVCAPAAEFNPISTPSPACILLNMTPPYRFLIRR